MLYLISWLSRLIKMIFWEKSTISHRDNWKFQILNDQKSCLQLTLDTFELQADLY